MPGVDTPAIFEFIGAHEQALFYKITKDYFFHKDFGCKFGRCFGLMSIRGRECRADQVEHPLASRIDTVIHGSAGGLDDARMAPSSGGGIHEFFAAFHSVLRSCGPAEVSFKLIDEVGDIVIRISRNNGKFSASGSLSI